PLLLLPIIMRQLPESVGFMVREGRHAEATAVLARVQPGFALQAGEQLSMPSAKAAGASVLQLFRDGRALRTVMLWVAFFCCLLMVYALASWL
ncbi:MFS transporter, partial [Acinetobacter baumannii]